MIDQNYIGGSAALAYGAAWTKTNTFTNAFTAINMNVATGINTVDRNTIKNFVWGDAGASTWTAINIAAGDVNVGSNGHTNTIGALTGTGSITVTAAATGANVYGINIATTGIVNCNYTTIGSIIGANAATLATNVYGINKTATAGATVISHNFIGSSTTANSLNASSASSSNQQSVYGIYYAGSANSASIHDNTITNLNNATTIAPTNGSVIGIGFAGTGTTNTVNANFIYGLTITGAGTTASIYGLKIISGTTTYANNIVSLGGNTTVTLYGIYDTGTAGQTCNLYYNTVYISGVPTAGAQLTHALYSASNSNTRDFRNNIFENVRSRSGGTSKHYAVYLNYTSNTNLTCNYNNYYSSGTGSVFGYYNTADVTSLANWKSVTS